MTLESQTLLRKLLKAIGQHPDFKTNPAFNRALNEGSYSRAVQEVERAVQGTEDNTWIVIPSNMPHISDAKTEQNTSDDDDTFFHIPGILGE